MKVALVTYSTRPRGGVVHTLGLAEALAAQGLDVTVVSLGRHGDGAFFRAVDPQVAVQLVPFPDVEGEDVGDRIIRSIRALGCGVDWAAFDVVHAQDCISANAAPRCIRTVHHLDRFTTPALAACHERAIVEPIAHICVSKAVAAEVRSGWGIDPLVIPNGVAAERFAAAADASPSSVAARARWRARIEAPWVLAVGGIEPRKGTLELVEAFAVARSELPSHRLVVAGGETLFDYRPYRAEVEDRCAALGVEPLVLGPVPDADLPALFAASDVLAMPSTKEGFGLAAMEALAAGVPVVLSELPVFAEVFGSTVRYGSSPATLAEALVDAVQCPDPDQVQRGRHLAARHTWLLAADAHLALYESLVGSRS
ncbi:MSMEG_0565 family glycosyltransferase [Aquihabitans sp. G128]|uniref:MSMEG_0565 family glycosyltransferase n=1 Tax=Aquihabitans sp. G128 TaxID=2849779 RepID=UPI001C229943|nr:MSMEG_0565 family glycosyltransferase [Aquihabitans sp. G128]QXC61043.1 MSMEG_0565 family glycosyltransferase [Aquihabitans sp. G128]